MPRTRKGLFPFLLPGLVIVPLAGLLVLLLAMQWRAMDQRAAVQTRVGDVASLIGAELQAGMQRQETATELLSRSPMVWLWVKFQGQRLTASNRSHEQMALDEAANYGKLLPGAAVYLASEKTHTLYRDGAAVAGLSRAEQRDAWYDTALKTEGVVVSADAREVRVSARIMEGTSLLGAVSCVSDAGAVADEALSEVTGETGLAVALTDGAGAVVRALGKGASGASTIFDLYDGTPRDVIRSLMGSQPGHVSNVVFIAKSRSLLTAAVPTSALGWRLFVSAELPVRMPAVRSVILIAVPVVALGLLLLALAWIASTRLTPLFTRIRLLEQERNDAVGKFQEIGTAALRAHSAAAGLNALAGALTREAAGAAQSGKAAAELFSLAESHDEELRSGIASRLSLLMQITSAARQVIERTRAAREPAAAIGRNAADGEEQLSRVIASGASVSRAVEKALKESEAMGQAGDRLKLLSLNAALEASRSGGQQLSRITGEISGQAEDAMTRARALSAALTEAGSSMETVAEAAQEAGRIVHETAAALSEVVRAVDGAGEDAETLFARMESANANAELVRNPASTADRGRSAMEGIIRIVARIGTLAGEVTGLAGRVSADCAQAARPAEATSSAAAPGEPLPQSSRNS